MYAQNAIQLPEPIMPKGYVPSDNLVFHLGITMAGAVSAGAYTSGVIYQLMEMLDAWEAAKSANRRAEADHGSKEEAIRQGDWDPSVPMHDVVIDVLGGASAGAVAAVLTAMSFHYQRGSVKNVLEDNEDCMLFDAWVNLNDPNVSTSRDGKTLDQMLKTDVFTTEKRFVSFLSGKPLDNASKRVLTNLGLTRSQDNPLSEKVRAARPRYASDNLDVILTITSLRGARAQLYFSKNRDSGPAHVMKLHRGIAHFTIDNTPDPDGSRYQTKERVDLTNYDHLNLMISTALASGAFPIGLPPRQLTLSSQYLNRYLTQYYGDKLVPEHMTFPDTDSTQKFVTYSVDGGTMNNEPFAEVFAALKEKTEEAQEGSEKMHCTAFIVIDPFPNFEDADQDPEDPEMPSNILTAAKELIGAMLNQSRVKARGMLELMMSDESTYGMIFPSYRNSPYGNNEALATGAFEGFAGFLDRKLREHDFLLGRRNCQSFLRSYFSSSAETVDGTFALFQDWAQDDPRFKRFAHEAENAWRIPIIPDMAINNSADYADQTKRRSYPAPVRARLSDIKDLKPALRKRILYAMAIIGWKNLKLQLTKPFRKKKEGPTQIWTEKITLNMTGEWLWTLVGLGLIAITIWLMERLDVNPVFYAVIPALGIAMAYVIVKYLANKAASAVLKLLAKDLRKRNQLDVDS